MANPYMPFYTGDYLRKTRRLKDRHHGAYLLILFALWDEGGSLPYDLEELREIARSDRRSWGDTWNKISGFFTISEGRISHARVDQTIAEVSEKRQSYVERGKRGGAKSAEKRKKISTEKEAKVQRSSSNQTKGLVSATYVAEKPNLSDEKQNSVPGASAIAPSPEMGGALSAAASEALKEIRYAATKRPAVSLAHMDAIKRSVRGFDGETFDLDPVSLPADAWAAICEEASAKGYAFRQPDGLRIVGGQAA